MTPKVQSPLARVAFSQDAAPTPACSDLNKVVATDQICVWMFFRAIQLSFTMVPFCIRVMRGVRPAILSSSSSDVRRLFSR